MNEEQVVHCLTYLGQLDPRVQINEATSDLWFYAIEALPQDQVIWVMRDYYATANPNSVGGVPALTPATLKHRLRDMRERTESKQRALEPPAKIKNPMSYRQRNPEEFARLMAKGRDDRRAELARRGIPLTQFQIDGDKPNGFQMPA